MFKVQIKHENGKQQKYETWQNSRITLDYETARVRYLRLIRNFRIIRLDKNSPILHCRIIDSCGSVWDQFSSRIGITRAYNNDHISHVDQTKTERELYPTSPLR